MEELRLIKCPTCGESGSSKQISNDMFECSVCNTKYFYLDSKIQTQFNNAQTALELYNFSEAEGIYDRILDETEDEKAKVMCYFGKLLAYFGIVYIKDFNKNLIVTFSKYDPKFSSIKESSYYKDIENSKYFNLYAKDLEKINIEYGKIKDELNKETQYDVFICTKISLKTKDKPDIEGFTVDSKHAEKLYYELTKRGLRVFYSEKTLSGIEYDAQIYSALMRSKSILVISSKKEYLESAWVRSEWERWLNFIDKGLKENNSLFLYILEGNHFPLPSILQERRPQEFKDSIDLINIIEKTLNINPSKSIKEEIETLEKELSQDFLKKDYSPIELIKKSLKLIEKYNKLSELEKNEFATSVKNRIEKIIGDYEKAKSLSTLINKISENNRENDVLNIKNKCEKVDYNVKKLIDNLDILVLQEKIVKYEKIVRENECNNNENDLKILIKKINKMEEAYDELLENNHSPLFNNLFSDNNAAYKSMIQNFEKVILKLKECKNKVLRRDGKILLTADNIFIVDQYLKATKSLNYEVREKYKKDIKDLDKLFLDYKADLDKQKELTDSFSMEIKKINKGSNKIVELQKRYNSFSNEQRDYLLKEVKQKYNSLIENLNDDLKEKAENKLNIFYIFSIISLLLSGIVQIIPSIDFHIVLGIYLITLVLIIINIFYLLKIKKLSYHDNKGKSKLVFNIIILVLIFVFSFVLSSLYYNNLFINSGLIENINSKLFNNESFKDIIQKNPKMILSLISLIFILIISIVSIFKANSKKGNNIINSKSVMVGVLLFICLFSFQGYNGFSVITITDPEFNEVTRMYQYDQLFDFERKFTINNPEKFGYNFSGWRINDSDTLENQCVIDLSKQRINQCIIVWDIEEYTITFDTNDTNITVPSVDVEYLGSFELPTIIKQGYTFLGWYYNEVKIENGNFEWNEDIVLEAKWSPNTYTITYYVNGGEMKGENTQEVVYDSEYTLEIPTREGYEFLGWYGNDKLFESGKWSYDEDVEIIAKWEPITCEITFDANGGKLSSYLSAKYTYGKQYDLPIPTKEGYEFDGWYNGDILIQNSGVWALTQNLELVAQWNKIYTISFNSNGGSEIPNMIGVSGKTINPPMDPIKENYVFGGWYIDKELTQEFEFTTMPNKNITLYAKWGQTYSIFFVTNGGTAVSSIKVIPGTSLSDPFPPTKDGYIFDCWCMDKELTQKYSFDTMPTKNITLYAKWKTYYEITFESNGGSSVSPINALQETNISEPDAPTKMGYIFENWYKDESLTERFIFNTMPSKNITLYAKWVPNDNLVLSEKDGTYIRNHMSMYNSVYNGLTFMEKIQWDTAQENIEGYFKKGYYAINDEGRAKQPYDHIKLSNYNLDYNVLKNEGYTKVTVKISLSASDIYDGYRYIFLYTAKGDTGDSGKLGSYEFTLSSKNQPVTCTFTFDIDEMKANQFYVRYGASGENRDFWVNKDFRIEIKFFK